MTTPDARGEPRTFLRALYEEAVSSALPVHRIGAFLPGAPVGRTLVLGAGKAGGSMGAAVDALWPREAPLCGLVVTRYAHVPPAYAAAAARIEMVEAAHPVPDAAGLQAALRMVQMTHGLTSDDLVLCLLSGGGSALLALPAEGVSLDDKRAINQALLSSGAAIDEMNCVRKHLSAVKGGRLAMRCAPAKVVSLLISDVPGDDPALVASGPTVPDASTCADALAILARYRIEVPPALRIGLERGAFETPKPGDVRFASHQVHVIATPRQSLEAAAALARRFGIDAHVLGDDIEGEARVVGGMHAALARSVARHGTPFARKPCVILSGGETTVTVKNPRGRGGRAAEFLLGTALALQGEAGVHVLAADTDGIDGSEDNAGALVAPDTLVRAQALGLSAQRCLDDNDAYGFFERLGDLLVTGPTFTNVNDFRALLVV